MTEIGKECVFPLSVGLPRPFARAKWSCCTNGVTANPIAERPLVSQSRGRATNLLWGRGCVVLFVSNDSVAP